MAQARFWFWFWVEKLLWRWGTAANAVSRRHASSMDHWSAVEAERQATQDCHLCNFERRVHSQNGEDGVLAEIFRRVGMTNRFLVEFGCGDGTENCTRLLVENGWSGLWIDADPVAATRARTVTNGQDVRVDACFTTRENIVALLASAGVPQGLDLVVVDIDGNDHWLWERVATAFRPRVCVVEGNSTFPPPVTWRMRYKASHVWQRTWKHSASLTHLEAMGFRLGYRLVACESRGTNAFFVRDDIAALMDWGNDGSAESCYTAPKHHPATFGQPKTVIRPRIPRALSEDELRKVTIADVRVVTEFPVRPGQYFYMLVHITNGSPVALDSTGNHRLHSAVRFEESLHADHVVEPERTTLPWPVPPGSGRWVVCQGQAPRSEGRHAASVVLVQENVAWLEHSAHPLVVAVE
jgi:hypothetical protein